MPSVWEENSGQMKEIHTAVYSYVLPGLRLITTFVFRMLLTRAVRPDRLIIAAKSFVQSVFGPEFVQKAEALLNFEQIINEEVVDS